MLWTQCNCEVLRFSYKLKRWSTGIQHTRLILFTWLISPKRLHPSLCQTKEKLLGTTSPAHKDKLSRSYQETLTSLWNNPAAVLLEAKSSEVVKWVTPPFSGRTDQHNLLRTSRGFTSYDNRDVLPFLVPHIVPPPPYTDIRGKPFGEHFPLALYLISTLIFFRTSISFRKEASRHYFLKHKLCHYGYSK